MAERDLAGLSSIVVGTDFSKDSDRALERAVQLASDHGSAVTIVHVAPGIPRALLRRVTGSSAPPEKQRLNELVAQCRDRGVRASARYVEGRAVSSLAEIARDRDADLLVVGARGRAVADEFLGSTAERVVDTETCPVLVARRAARPYRRVLAAGAIDSSTSLVLEAAKAFLPSATIDLLHVYEAYFEATFVMAGVDAEAISEHRRVLRAEARTAMKRTLASSAVQPDAVVLQLGDPRVEVARHAQRGKYDLVVLARGRSRAKRWLLGSVTRSVLRDASADVLLL